MLIRWGFFMGLVGGCLLGGGLFFGAAFGLAGTPTMITAGPASIVAAKRMILAEPVGPKIILVGGSSVDLGISARRIEEQTGIPCRNFGLWVPLGIEFMLDQVRASAHQGDTVVLALEFELCDWPGTSRLWADPQFLPLVFSQEADFLKTRPLEDRLGLGLRLPLTWPLEAILRRACPPSPPAAATDGRKNMNAWGDRTDNTRTPRAALPPKVVQPSPELAEGFSVSPKGFPTLSRFCAYARTNGITVVATFPNLARNPAYNRQAARETRARLQAFYRELGVPFVGTFDDAQFPPEDCYDSMYHLFADAVIRRTDRLAGQLAPILDKNPGRPPASDPGN
jgi:hypothetical protein